MAQFPLKEAEVLNLAQVMLTGLAGNPTVFPSPTVPLEQMEEAINEYTIARDALAVAQSQVQMKQADKDSILGIMIERVKTNLRYAENQVSFDDARLRLIGWSGRKAAGTLEAPGQPRTLEAPKQGEGWLFLDWKEPVDGGKVAAYKVQRRQRPDGPWTDVATAIESEIMLMNQERNKEWEYCVVAVNKAGESVQSNTVMAVL